VAKGRAFGAAQSQSSRQPQSPTTSLAERQVRQRDDAYLQAKKDLEKERKEKKRLQEQIAALQKAATGAAAVDAECSVVEPDADAAKLDNDIADAQVVLDSLVQLPKSTRSLVFGDGDAYQGKLDEAKAKLDELKAQKQRGKPMGAQLAAANRDVSKAAKATEASAAKVLQLQEQADSLQKQLQDNQAAQGEAKAQKLKADQELAAARERLAQLAKPAALQEDGADALPTVPPPGMVSVAEAEKAWAEREKQFLEMFEKLRAQAEAADDIDLDDLESLAPSEASEAPEVRKRKSEEAEERKKRLKAVAAKGKAKFLANLSDGVKKVAIKKMSSG